MISVRNQSPLAEVRTRVSSALFASIIAVIVSAISMATVIMLTTALYAADDARAPRQEVSDVVVPLETTLQTDSEYYVYPSGNLPMIFTT